jgi:hypothetical protein
LGCSFLPRGEIVCPLDGFAQICETPVSKAAFRVPRFSFDGSAMPPKMNPLKLNPLQLRTLTLLQALARLPNAAKAGPGPGEVTIHVFPNAHGDHFHLGDAVVAVRDATGLYNEKVWNALSRKALIRAEWPHQLTMTPAGLGYDTGLADEILHTASH